MAHAGDVALEGFKLFQKTVQDHYRGDPTGAGLTCAWIHERQVWYLSVCRYHDPYGDSKEVVAKAEDKDWTKAFYKLAEQWLTQVAHMLLLQVQTQNWIAKEFWLDR